MRGLGLAATAWLALGAGMLSGCESGSSSDDEPRAPEGATETNVTRLACMSDDECLDGGECEFASEDAKVGLCTTEGEGERVACAVDEDCGPGQTCADGECATPTAGGAAGGTCLAGSPECEGLGPADEPAGGTCLAGSPECEGLGPADEPAE